MIFEMKKFGSILNSRPAGREAVLRVQQLFNGNKDLELIFDFREVEILTPSFADEFFSGIKRIFEGKSFKIINYEGRAVLEEVLKGLMLV